MKTTYKIQFENGEKCMVEYSGLVNFMNQNGYNKTSTKTFNKNIQNIKNESFKYLIDLSSKKNFNFFEYKGSHREKYKSYLTNLTATLCLANSKKLENLLYDLGYDEYTVSFFQNKKIIDKTVQDLKALGINDETIIQIQHLSYMMILVKCKAQVERYHEDILPNRSKSNKIPTKKILEQELRKKRRDGKLKLSNTTKEFQSIMNSEAGTKILEEQNETLSMNHSGSYNLRKLAFIIFLAIREELPDETLDNEIIFALGELFKLIYLEKDLITNPNDYDAFDALKSNQSKTGDNFRTYIIKKIKVIIGYDEKDHIEEMIAYASLPGKAYLNQLYKSIS